MANIFSPIDPGTHEATLDTATDNAQLEARNLKVSKSETLRGLSEQYFFFSHAALLIHGKLPVDPLAQFCAQLNCAKQLKILVFDTPIFKGLERHGDPAFNYTLFALPNEFKEELLFNVGTIGIKHTNNKAYVNVVVQTVPLLDYLAVFNQTHPDLSNPYIWICLFALDGSDKCMHFVPPNNPLTDQIALTVSSPREEMVQLAARMFQ